MTDALQPQQRKGQAVFDSVRGLAVRDAQHRPLRRASAKNATRVVSRKRMLEVGGNSQRFHDFIGELFGKDAAKLLAKGVTSDLASRAIKIHANKFDPAWFAAPKPPHGQGQALFGVIDDGQNAAREVVVGGPQVEQRLLRRAAHLPGKAAQSDYASAVFADLHVCRGGKFAESGFQFCGELHARDYKTGYPQLVLLRGYYCLEAAKSKPVTRTAGCRMFHDVGMCSKETSNDRRAPGLRGGLPEFTASRDSRSAI